MRLKLIACEVFYRELALAIARSVNQVDVEFLPKGLHDLGRDGMLPKLRDTLAAVDESKYDAVLLGYGLCSNGVVGLAARTIPLVIPRAHDCITLFLGSKERYLAYFHEHPAVYFKTTGWIERGEGDSQQSPTLAYAELVAKYGEDNARYLQEQLNTTRNCTGVTFIEMGIEPDDRFERLAQKQAEERGLEFEKLRGDMTLLTQLVDGPWDADRFLVVPPGHEVAPSYDAGVIKSVPVNLGATAALPSSAESR